MSSTPSMTGIITSVTTSSGADSCTACSAAAPSFGFAHFVPGPLEDPPEQETLVRFVINQQILDPRCRALIINT